MNRIYELAVVQLLNCLRNGNNNVQHILDSSIFINLHLLIFAGDVNDMCLREMEDVSKRMVRMVM